SITTTTITAAEISTTATATSVATITTATATSVATITTATATSVATITTATATSVATITTATTQTTATTTKITNALQANRWFVSLGDPGSAKTTLLRWITHIFAEAAYHEDEEIVFEEESVYLTIRIPIRIRIVEFAEWLIQHQTKTLIDYIGEHTWFSERYCHAEDGNVLKELIYHDHALILLVELMGGASSFFFR
ncbi:unnamed protein product, partial [Rotaria sp. Silwood1]